MTARRGAGALGELIAVVAVAALGLFAAVWHLTGGRLLTMQTASMTPRVPVGSLIAIRPLAGRLTPGELINFHPPGDRWHTYTHLVARVLRGGAIQTRSVAAPRLDPWTVTRADVVGRVVFHVPFAGWLLPALPLLAVSVLGWLLAGRRLPRDCRPGVAWATATILWPVVAYHPLVAGTVLGTAVHHGVMTIRWANTGLLPLTMHIRGGSTAAAGPGAIASLTGRVGHGIVHVRGGLRVTWWEVCALALGAAALLRLLLAPPPASPSAALATGLIRLRPVTGPGGPPASTLG